MDQGFPKGCWEGDDHCAYCVFLLLFRLLKFSQDSTIDFEKRRNVPVRYDRELVQTTIKAMKRIGEIRSKRERAFFKNRYVLPVPSTAQLALTHSLPFQYGRCPRQAEGSPQEGAGCCKDDRQATGTFGSFLCTNTAKNQDRGKVAVGTGPWRRSFHGYGYRLVILCTCGSPVLYFSLFLCFYDSTMFTTSQKIKQVLRTNDPNDGAKSDLFAIYWQGCGLERYYRFLYFASFSWRT